MQKRSRVILIGASSALGLLIAVMLGYVIAYSQDVIEGFEVNTPDCDTKILIASQGSNFKSALLSALVARIKSDDVYIKVVDATVLSAEREDLWDAIIIVTTVEWYRLPRAVRAFLEAVKPPERIVLVLTSGEGTMVPGGTPVDAITSASEVEEVGEKLTAILAKIESALGTGPDF